MELTTNLPIQQWCVCAWPLCVAAPTRRATMQRAHDARVCGDVCVRCVHTGTRMARTTTPSTGHSTTHPSQATRCGCTEPACAHGSQTRGHTPWCEHASHALLPAPTPPLLLLQSYVHGLFVGRFDPAAVRLHTSRGHESHFSKQLMRWTVLLSDLLRECARAERACVQRPHNSARKSAAHCGLTGLIHRRRVTPLLVAASLRSLLPCSVGGSTGL
jgi:hypothetical protein